MAAPVFMCRVNKAHLAATGSPISVLTMARVVSAPQVRCCPCRRCTWPCKAAGQASAGFKAAPSVQPAAAVHACGVPHLGCPHTGANCSCAAKHSEGSFAHRLSHVAQPRPGCPHGARACVGGRGGSWVHRQHRGVARCSCTSAREPWDVGSVHTSRGSPEPKEHSSHRTQPGGRRIKKEAYESTFSGKRRREGSGAKLLSAQRMQCNNGAGSCAGRVATVFAAADGVVSNDIRLSKNSKFSGRHPQTAFLHTRLNQVAGR